MCKLMAHYKAPFSPEELRGFYVIGGRSNPHASGVLEIGESGNAWVVKAPVKGEILWGKWGEEILAHSGASKVGLYHVRFATHGSPSKGANNHPIYSTKDEKLETAIVHNGVVNPPKWLPADGETDTEQLLRYWLKDGPSSWAEFTGYGAIVLWDAGHLYCYTSGTPLYWRRKGEGVQLVQVPVLGTVWEKVPEDVLFRVHEDGLTEIDKLTFKQRVVEAPWYLLDKPGKHDHTRVVPVGKYKVRVVCPKDKAPVGGLFVVIDPRWLNPGDLLASYRSRVGHGNTLYVHWPTYIPTKAFWELAKYLVSQMRDHQRVDIGDGEDLGRAVGLLAGLIVLIEEVPEREALALAKSRLWRRGKNEVGTCDYQIKFDNPELANETAVERMQGGGWW